MATNNSWNNSSPGVSVGATGDTSLTAYAVLCGGTTSTGAIQSIASVGTSSQVLTSNGAAALPTFQSASATAGDWILLSTITGSGGANIDFLSLVTSTYSTYVVIFTDVLPDTNATTLRMLVSIDNSTFLTSGYLAGNITTPYNSTTQTNSSATSNCPLISTTSASSSLTPKLRGIVWLYDLDIASSAGGMYFRSNCFYQNSSSVYTQSTSKGCNTTSSAVTALRFTMSSGNITSGSFSLYGITK